MFNNELNELRALREAVDRLGEMIDQAIARREDRAAEEQARRRRAAFTALPVSIGLAAMTIWKWASSRGSAAQAAIASGAVLTATAAVIVVPQISNTPGRAGAARNRPPVAAPAATGAPHSTPTRNRPSTPPPSVGPVPPAASPSLPSLPLSALPLPEVSVKTHLPKRIKVYPTRPTHPVLPMSGGHSRGNTRDCRLEVLNLGVLCDRLR